MAVGFARDIKPKFRPQDLQCMGRRHINLDDAQWMCDPAGNFGFPDHGNARRVFERLDDGSMPMDGPWPKDWLDTYRAWMSGGFQP